MLGAALAALTYEFVFTLKIDHDQKNDINKNHNHRRELEYSVRSESAELEKYDNVVIGNKMTQMT